MNDFTTEIVQTLVTKGDLNELFVEKSNIYDTAFDKQIVLKKLISKTIFEKFSQGLQSVAVPY